MIVNHSIFQNVANKKKQISIKLQLLVLLKYLGGYGNGVSMGCISRFFGNIGEGTVILYIDRCLVAIHSL